jgi:hypothetical protein
MGNRTHAAQTQKVSACNQQDGRQKNASDH